MILAIESAIAGGSFAFIKDGDRAAGWSGPSDVSRAEHLLPAIEETMIECGIDRSALSMIGVSAGPGSFTGIRIGMSTALGLAAGLRIPVASVSILKAMAASAEGSAILAAVPMGRASICIQTFSKGKATILENDLPVTLTESDFVGHIRNWKGTVVVHAALTGFRGDREIFDVGLDLASLVGKYCQQHPNESERPLFISKSF